MHDLTVWPSLAGGILIGLASAGLLAFHGRIAGISGITGGALSLKRGDTAWRVAFLAGLVLAGLAMSTNYPQLYRVAIVRSDAALLIAGALVGVGTQIGRGCTSGHGVCGIGRLSRRSITATVVFMATAAITVTAIRFFSAGAV